LPVEPPPTRTGEHSLAAELEPAWAAKPLALTRHEGPTILVLADPGGEPLDRFLERDREKTLDLAHLLGLAINLPTALGHAHQRGLIHKDVKPENVLVDDDGHVWLAGFVRLLAKMRGSAVRLLRGRKPIFGGACRNGGHMAALIPFRLRTDDSSDRLLIPETLYGREREIDSLVVAFDRVAHATGEHRERYA
jgi:serine/threonine protein kinase